MPTSPWDAKRKAIAQTMQGTVAPGGLSLGNAGATFRTNPLMSFGRPAAAAPAAATAAPASGGLMGQAGGGGQMARMAQMPGFNYVPPPTGPAPVPQQAGAAGAALPFSQWSPADRMGLLAGRRTPTNASTFDRFSGQGAYDYNYNPGGSGNNRYRR